MNQIINAINFAAIAHANQRRKDADSTPYINHPILVTKILSDAGVTDHEILCAGVLHDTIEDTNVCYSELCKEFGREIADIVQECSDDKSLSKLERKKNQVLHASKCSNAAKLVKIADKIANCTSLCDTPPASWSSSDVDGYFVWAYAVWLNLKGVNVKLDAQILSLFIKNGLHDANSETLNEKLQSYYNTMQ